MPGRTRQEEVAAVMRTREAGRREADRPPPENVPPSASGTSGCFAMTEAAADLLLNAWNELTLYLCNADKDPLGGTITAYTRPTDNIRPDGDYAVGTALHTIPAHTLFWCELDPQNKWRAWPAEPAGFYADDVT